jgi:hypothetical protein
MRRHGVAPGGGAGAPARTTSTRARPALNFHFQRRMSRQAKSHEHSPIRLTFPLQQQGQQCDQLALGRARLPGGTATSWGSIGGT